MLEKQIETYLRDQVKKKGGMALKFVSPGNAGVPDRLILLPGRKMFFVECKAPGKKPTPIQVATHKAIGALDVEVYIVDSKEKINEILTA